MGEDVYNELGALIMTLLHLPSLHPRGEENLEVSLIEYSLTCTQFTNFLTPATERHGWL